MMKTMTKMLLLTLGIGITALLSGDELLAKGKGHKGWGHKGHHSHLEKMTKKLDLSDDQQADLKIIFEEKKEKMAELNKQMKELKESFQEKVKSLLNDKQLKKYEKMKTKMLKKYKKKGKRHGNKCICSKCKWKDQ